MMNDNLSLGRTPEEGRKRRRCPVSASTSPFLTKGSSSSTLSPIEMAEMVTMNGDWCYDDIRCFIEGNGEKFETFQR